MSFTRIALAAVLARAFTGPALAGCSERANNPGSTTDGPRYLANTLDEIRLYAAFANLHGERANMQQHAGAYSLWSIATTGKILTNTVHCPLITKILRSDEMGARGA